MNIKNFFSKQLQENIAKSLHFRTAKYLDNIKEKRTEASENAWLSQFKGKDSFLHVLDKELKIQLYKDSVLSRLIFNGFEEEEITFIKKVLRASDYFIDIGANIGLFSLHASRIVGENGRVISFEPSPKTFERLKENIEVNKFTNLTLINQGLSDKQGSLELNVSENGYDAWNSFAKIDVDMMSKKIEVPVNTLDSYLDDQNIDKSKISLVKIDVEGWEKFVLAGSYDFLNFYSPTLLIEFTESNTFNAGYFVQEIYDYLYNIGYKWYKYTNGKLVKEERNLHYPYDNLIATKDYRKLASLLLN